jgi:hypothetical protein
MRCTRGDSPPDPTRCRASHQFGADSIIARRHREQQAKSPVSLCLLVRVSSRTDLRDIHIPPSAVSLRIDTRQVSAPGAFFPIPERYAGRPNLSGGSEPCGTMVPHLPPKNTPVASIFARFLHSARPLAVCAFANASAVPGREIRPQIHGSPDRDRNTCCGLDFPNTAGVGARRGHLPRQAPDPFAHPSPAARDTPGQAVGRTLRDTAQTPGPLQVRGSPLRRRP